MSKLSKNPPIQLTIPAELVPSIVDALEIGVDGIDDEDTYHAVLRLISELRESAPQAMDDHTRAAQERCKRIGGVQ